MAAPVGRNILPHERKKAEEPRGRKIKKQNEFEYKCK
jgi:hypothetical protein